MAEGSIRHNAPGPHFERCLRVHDLLLFSPYREASSSNYNHGFSDMDDWKERLTRL